MELRRGRPFHNMTDVARYPWYDSVWLADYVRAREIVRAVRPDALPAFVDAFRVLQTPPDFEVKFLERPFDDRTIEDIRAIVQSLRPTDLELHEARDFGRFVVHDHPLFTELQDRTAALVRNAVGEPVEPSYNFLSLYGSRGVCAPHMDAPKAKWTFDFCINQSAPWPIYFSQVCPWPEPGSARWTGDWEAGIRNDPSLRFAPYSLKPGQAVIFSGSSQWHYRDPIPPQDGRAFCELLFFHYIPKGASDLVRPTTWARVFGIPELRRAGA
jgi:hypothetical protein